MAVCIAITLTLFASTLLTAQPNQEAIDEFRTQTGQWAEATNEFIGDTPFQEVDIQNFVEHFPNFSAFTETGIDWEQEGAKPWGANMLVDYTWLVVQPEYLAWAKEAGVEAAVWLPRSLRVHYAVMGEQMKLSAAETDARWVQQTARLEEKREEIGEEMYNGLSQSIAMGRTMMEINLGMIGKLPQPDEAEQALIEEHLDAIMAAIEADLVGEAEASKAAEAAESEKAEETDEAAMPSEEQGISEPAEVAEGGEVGEEMAADAEPAEAPSAVEEAADVVEETPTEPAEVAPRPDGDS